MRYAFWTVDVFTDREFGGNPLAVIPYANGLSTEQMQLIAREFNLSETAFVLPPENPEHTFRLRIFTPARELPFAGHPTIGSAFVLGLCGRIELKNERTRVVFGETVGSVPVEIRAASGKPVFTQLTTAKAPEWGPPPPPSEIVAAMLSLDPTDVLDDAHDEPQSISCGMPFLYVPLASLDAVKRARLNWEWWNQYLASAWAPQVYAFSYEVETDGATIHARAFTHAVGIEEDPATGSAASGLAGYLAKREKLRDGTTRWRVEQGMEMGRPSTIDVEADLLDGAVTAVRVGGASVVVSEGHLIVP
jgi:trans-2,3-dihydro-3-hydroxyanthranilate isomerase